ncbi:MAG: electron transport complex subunit RsxE [Brevinema sp.]
MANQVSSWSDFEKGLLKDNPVFVLLIGLCSSLAISTNVSSALAMGLSALVVLIFSNVLISSLRNIIPSYIRVPAYIIVIAGFTTIVEILLGRYVPLIYSVLGVYLPLIVVNCIILGRAESFASKNNVFRSFLDGLGMGLGYTLALVSVAILRELLGNGTLSFRIAEDIGVVLNFTKPVLQDPSNSLVHVVNLFGAPAAEHNNLAAQHLTLINVAHIVPDPLQVMLLPPGGFLVMGLYLTILQHISLTKAKNKALAAAAARAKNNAEGAK